MIESATLRLSSLVKRTSRGDAHSAYRRNGCVTEILIALTVLMRTQLYTTAQHLSRVLTINSPAKMDVALTKAGHAITIMIVEMDQMKANSVMRNTRHARLKNLLVRISNAFEINIDAVS